MIRVAEFNFNFHPVRISALIASFLLAATPTHAQPNKLNIRLVGTNKPPQASSGFGDVWGEGSNACMGVWTAYSTFGFGVYDISNPSTPLLKTNYTFGSGVGNRFEQGVIRDKILYVGSWGASRDGSGTHIISLTNPAAPVLLSRITTNTAGTVTKGFNDVHTLFLERNFLYLAAHNTGIVSVKVFNVANPSAPVYVRDIVTTNTTKVHQITASQKGASTILYTSGWGGNSDGNTNSLGQTDIWDVSNIGSQPAQWLGRVYSGYNSHSSWPTADGNMLVVCRETPGGDVSFYDISTPSHPSADAIGNPPPLLTINPASMGIEGDIPHNPVIVSNFLFISWYQNGIQIFDITDRTNPVRVAFWDTYAASPSQSYQGNWGIYPSLGFDKILLSDIQSGFIILDASSILTPTNNYPPLIVKSPPSITATQGLTATLTPRITGSQLNYQWKRNGTVRPGATSSNLVISNVQASDAGSYTVTASNATGLATSGAGVLSVIVPSGAPGISSQPQSLSVFPHADAVFTVGVTGAAPFSFQWRFNANPIPNETNSSLTVLDVDAPNIGNYSVTVTNAIGSVTSSNALLTLSDSPYINNVRATPGARSALISWDTSLLSDSVVQFDLAGQSPLSLSSYTDPALKTNHVVLITGLSPDTSYSYQVISSVGGTNYISTYYQFSTAGKIILDNPALTLTGSWTTNNTSTDKYLSNYVYASNSASSTNATATFRPNILIPGKYDVEIWYPQGGNRANNAPHTISYNGGASTVPVNQQANGGGWRLIGSALEFAQGTSGFLRIGNFANPSVIMADAARFSYVDSQDITTGTTIPSWWQNFYFGGPIDPLADPDGDSYTTAQEYVMGTIPNDPVSRLQFTGETSSNSVQVSFWPYLPDRNYQLLYRSDLGASGWQVAAAGPITPTADGQGIFTIALDSAPRNFYRLKVQINSGPSFIGSATIPATKSFAPFDNEPKCGPNRVYAR